MQHTRTWTDIYGSACASFEGRAGGHRWLVAAPPELAAGVPAALETVDGKGSVQLVVHDGLTPLLSAVQGLKPRGVLIVAPAALTSGPGVQVPPQTLTTEGGLSYQEGGDFPAWQAWNVGRGEVQAGLLEKTTGESAAASAVASLQVPLLVIAPGEIQASLEHWMDATPHGR